MRYKQNAQTQTYMNKQKVQFHEKSKPKMITMPPYYTYSQLVIQGERTPSMDVKRKRYPAHIKLQAQIAV